MRPARARRSRGAPRPNPLWITPGGVVLRGRVVVPRASLSITRTDGLIPNANGGRFPGMGQNVFMDDPVFCRNVSVPRDAEGRLMYPTAPEYTVMDHASYEELVAALKAEGLSIERSRMPDGRIMSKAVGNVEENSVDQATGRRPVDLIIVEFVNQSGLPRWGFDPVEKPKARARRRPTRFD